MLKIENLSINYDNNKKVAVDKFNLSMEKGEIISIVGESGSGKSTIIKAILGILSASAEISNGKIIFEGESLIGKSREELRKLRGTKISMIFQDCVATLNPIRKIGKQYVEYICTHSQMNKKEAWNLAVNMLEKMRLPDGENIMNSYPYQLSGGMCQRVGIAIAMTFKPVLLLADEPTSALDVTNQSQIVKQMMELRDDHNTSILLVTHNMGVAAYMADKIIVMKDGKIMDYGTKEDLLYNSKSDYTKELLNSIPEMEGESFVK